MNERSNVVRRFELIGRATEIVQKDGLKRSVSIGRRFADHWIKVASLCAIYRLRYGDAAPMVDETCHVDPAQIEYGLSKRFPEDAPPFGVVGGDWDQKKVHRFEHGEMWQGLLTRYRDDKDWEDTRYYQRGVEKLRDGETLLVLDEREQSLETFEAYMQELDEIYDNMKTEGYDQSVALSVTIGRNGELMLYGDGNHRTTIAQAVGVESIPVSIVYRHQQWQDLRTEVSNATDRGKLSDSAKRHLDHPDVRPLFDD